MINNYFRTKLFLIGNYTPLNYNKEIYLRYKNPKVKMLVLAVICGAFMVNGHYGLSEV